MATNYRESLIGYGEKILGLYNINIIYVTFPKVDSLMKLDTMNDRDSLQGCFKAIIPELVKFPYSFLRKVGLLTITFTNSVLIYKSSESSAANKKIFRGIFPISKLTGPKERQ
jgi:hypothetical protein